MNLSKKKRLAAKSLKVGKERIVFMQSRLNEIKEAITKQDIKDLVQGGAIFVKDIKGKRKNQDTHKRRSVGNIRKKVNVRKEEYVLLTRKLRKYLNEVKKQGLIDLKEIKNVRKKIRNKEFRSKSHLKEYLGGLKK